MNFLVTGANGFVGNALTHALVAKNYVVVAVSRSFNAADSHVSQLVIKDLKESLDWSVPLSKTNVVVHLAARVHVMDEESSDPLQAFLEVNLHGTINLARQAAASGVKRFIYVSSIKVNGEYTQGSGFTEGDIPRPQGSYAISKWRAEEALLELSKDTEMEVVIIRPPLVYGAGVRANFLRLLTLINKSLPLPFSNINNQRSMVYVGNLVDAIITCATHPKVASQLYLVSDNELFSIPQLARALAKVLGKRCLFLPFPIAMMRFLASLLGKAASVDRLTQSLVVDSSKLRRELGWQPPYTLQQGLQATADWYLSTKKK